MQHLDAGCCKYTNSESMFGSERFQLNLFPTCPNGMTGPDSLRKSSLNPHRFHVKPALCLSSSASPCCQRRPLWRPRQAPWRPHTPSPPCCCGSVWWWWCVDHPALPAAGTRRRPLLAFPTWFCLPVLLVRSEEWGKKWLNKPALQLLRYATVMLGVYLIVVEGLVDHTCNRFASVCNANEHRHIIQETWWQETADC